MAKTRFEGDRKYEESLKRYQELYALRPNAYTPSVMTTAAVKMRRIFITFNIQRRKFAGKPFKI